MSDKKHPILTELQEWVEDEIKSSSFCHICSSPVEAEVQWFGDFSFQVSFSPCQDCKQG